MITKELKAAADKIEQAKNDLERAILDRVTVIAERMRYDEVRWGAYYNQYTRGGHDVESKQLDELSVFYCDTVNSGGLCCHWTKDDGWLYPKEIQHD